MEEQEEIEEAEQSETKETFYCRKCMRFLPGNNFYAAVDKRLVDTSGKFSVCKKCVQKIYNEIFTETNSMEKTIQKMCTTLNVKFSNAAMDACKAHITTLQDGGKNVNAIFSIFLMKLIATNPTMDKSAEMDLTYSDVGTIFTTETINTKEIPIPKDTIDFWGKDLSRGDIEYLESEYIKFKATHAAETYAQIVLLKQVCHTMLSIKKLRLAGDDTSKLVKELQELMKNLAISPNVINSANNAGGKSDEAFGLWIEDIEKEEPAQWLKTDPRGDMYRDVGNVEEYFQKYFVRPLKNFILNSRDFNVDSDEVDEVATPSEGIPEYTQIEGEEKEG
jgi:ferritin-like metal-binding protein YciE